MWTVLVAILCLLSGPAWAWPARVDRVVDGDTVEVSRGSSLVKIRLFGIDAPEHDQPGGASAAAALRSLVGGQEVEIVALDVDRYGRTVARVLLEGHDIGVVLVQTGHAWQFTRYDHGIVLRDAERAARAKRLGVWAEAGASPPWLWRAASHSRSVALGALTCQPTPRCSELTSCAAVREVVQRCGAGRLDHDHDGIACESLCGSAG